MKLITEMWNSLDDDEGAMFIFCFLLLWIATFLILAFITNGIPAIIFLLFSLVVAFIVILYKLCSLIIQAYKEAKGKY